MKEAQEIFFPEITLTVGEAEKEQLIGWRDAGWVRSHKRGGEKKEDCIGVPNSRLSAEFKHQSY